MRKCRQRASQSVWWPGLSKQLEELVKPVENVVNIKFKKQSNSSLHSYQIYHGRKWELIFLSGTYVLIVDYYSRYIEVAKLQGTTADEVVLHTKSIFARLGVPEWVISNSVLSIPLKLMLSLQNHMSLSISLVAHIFCSPMGKLRGLSRLSRIC